MQLLNLEVRINDRAREHFSKDSTGNFATSDSVILEKDLVFTAHTLDMGSNSESLPSPRKLQ
jgi:hypothetical protein